MAFIVFEGLDGAGKSTLIKKLTELLKSKKQSFIVTREPGGTPLGEEIRTTLLRTTGDTPTPRCELLLYEAIRAHHVEQKIKPALKKGEWVLCDRFTASSIAFQAGGRKIKEKDVIALNDFATNKLRPDLCVLLDLTVEESEKRRLKRVKETNEKLDRFEQEDKEFHNRIRKSYLKQAKQNKIRWLILDASQNPEKLFEDLKRKLNKWLK